MGRFGCGEECASAMSVMMLDITSSLQGEGGPQDGSGSGMFGIKAFLSWRQAVDELGKGVRQVLDRFVAGGAFSMPQ